MSERYLNCTELSNLREQVRIDIFSLLCASKDGLTEYELKKDYYQLNGKPIPYVELGHNSLNDLLLKYDFIEMQRHRNGHTWIYYAIPDQKSRDLAQLIAGQRDPNKAIREKHRNFEPSRNHQARNWSNRKNPYSSKYESAALLPKNVQNTIEIILKKSKLNHMWIEELEIEFKKQTGQVLNPAKYGFQNSRKMIESLDHFCQIENGSGNDFKIFLKIASIEEQRVIIENIKCLVDSRENEGISLKELTNLYLEKFERDLNFRKLGYSSLLHFLSASSFNHFELIEMEKNNFFIKKKNKNLNENNTLTADTQLIKNLIKCVDKALKNHCDVELSEEKFLDLFEKSNGFKLNPTDFGFDKMESLAFKLNNIGVFRVQLDYNFDPIYLYSSNRSYKKIFSSDSSTSLNSNTLLEIDRIKPANQYPSDESVQNVNINKKENELLKWRKNHAEFIQEFIFYEDRMSYEEIHKKILVKQEHEIIVSNVKNPSNFHIQLFANIESINKLMDDLEKIYYGIGSDYYNMSEEYVQVGKICVALFEKGEDWHRCRIIGLDMKTKMVQVEYIDYGGEAWVPINSLKFLLKDFSELPPQAIDACCSRIRPRPDHLWRKDIINYMLNRFVNKKLVAKVSGIRDRSVSIELFEQTLVNNNGRPAGTMINFNQRFVIDGYADFYDEENDKKFIKFDAWKEQYELNELEMMFSKKNGVESQVPDNSVAQNSLKLSFTSNSSVVSKVEYKLVDEMNDDSVLKEKSVNIWIEDQEHKLNLIWLDRKTFVHLSQLLDLVKFNEEVFVNFLNNEQFYKFFSQSKEEIFITKFLNTDQNLPIFNWLSFTLGLDLTDQKETFFVVYENLGKLVKKICSPSFSKLVDEAFISKKRNKRLLSPSELNRKVFYFEKQIDLLKKEILEDANKNSTKHQTQANLLLENFMEVKKVILNVIDNLY